MKTLCKHFFHRTIMYIIKLVIKKVDLRSA